MGKENYRIRNSMNLISSMRTYWLDLLITFSSVLTKYLVTVAATVMTAKMITVAINKHVDASAAKMMIILCVCVILRGLAHFGELYYGHKAAYQIQRDTRVKIYYKFDELAPAYMTRNHTASLGTLAMSDIEMLEWFLAHTVVNIIAAIIMVIVVWGITYRMNAAIAPIVLFCSMIIGLIPIMGAKIADKQGKEVREALSNANAVLMEGVQGITDFVALDYLARYKNKQKETVSLLYKAKRSYAERTGLESAGASLVAGIYTILCMSLCAISVQHGSMSKEMYPMMLSLSLISYVPILEVSASLRILGELFAAADRIQRLFEEEPVILEKSMDLEDTGAEEMDIEFCNVCFSYEKGKEVLHNVSFHIPYGKQVALVGPSGAGKTTCANLLLRYWDVDNGRILIGGKDIRERKLDSLRTITSAVLQDVYLFHISVMENIRLGKPEATDEEVIAAAKAANADEFIVGLPDGYQTITGERGFRLSGGQRQRIAIARAILRDAPILILDEAVSNLDAENEHLIEAYMKENSRKRTTLVIAHRMSTIMNADELIVIKEGAVVQQGNHEQLIREDGFYRDLMESQFGE